MTENYTEMQRENTELAEKFFEFLRFRLGRIEKKCNFAFLIVLVLGNNQ